MADQFSEQRHLLERLINRQIDDQAAQRGWSQGFNAFASQQSPGGTGGLDVDMPAIEFATGLSGGVTIVGFSFDVSPLDGTTDLLL
jgi:hypothetical protein